MQPPFFHPRSLAGTAWPPIPSMEASQVWAAYQALDRTQWLSPAEIQERQLQQLRVLLEHCEREVPWYRAALTRAGLAGKPIRGLADLRKLPILTREVYQENFADLQARHLPRGMKPAWSGHTSGTSGVPIRVHKSSRDGIWWNALFLRDLEWSDMDPRLRLAAVRLLALDPARLERALRGGSSAAWTPMCAELVESGPAYAMDIRQDPRRQLDWLRSIRPDYLVSLPSNLDYLARLLDEDGVPLEGLRAIQAIGEPVTEPLRRRVETAFRAPVRNLYSTTEGGYMASPCPLGHGLHVHEECLLVEVLDGEDRPVLPGGTGRLVFTTLHSFLAPFIRYDIQDEVTVASERCPCGRGLALWTAVDGRRHPLLHLPDGRRRASTGIMLGLRQVGGVRQFQVIQRATDHLVVRVVPDAGWTPEHATRMRAVIHSELQSGIRVDVEELSRIEPASGGKVRIVVNELESP